MVFNEKIKRSYLLNGIRKQYFEFGSNQFTDCTEAFKYHSSGHADIETIELLAFKWA